MTDLEAVHAAILAEPDDDLHRLAYADLLEERGGPGDDARADFVRVGLLMESTPHEPDDHDGDDRHVCACPKCDLIGRRAFLWCEHHDGNSKGDPPGEPWWPKRDGWYCGLDDPDLGDNPSLGCEVWLTTRRGFIENVFCTADQWREHGPRLVREHPIRVVRLTDKEPHTPARESYWYGYKASGHHDRAEIPSWLWPHVRRAVVARGGNANGHPSARTTSRDHALDALSEGCIAWAKAFRLRARPKSSPTRSTASSTAAASAPAPG